MWKCLGLGMLLVACSGESGLVSRDSGGGGERITIAGTGGDSAPTKGGASAGSNTDVGEGGSGAAGAPVGGSPVGGRPEEAGAAGLLGSAGTGGAVGSAGATSAGSSASGTGGGSSGGGPTAGAGGSMTEPDPCAGVIHWDESERWADLVTGALRHFAGSLWKCQAADYCRFYPGNGEPNGWAAVAACASGPLKEAECQCAEGACCDGCYIRPPSYFCGEVVRYARCTGKAPLSCPGSKSDIEGDYWNLFCSGDSAGECTRWGAHTKFAGTAQCGSGGLVCKEQGDQASCAACN